MKLIVLAGFAAIGGVVCAAVMFAAAWYAMNTFGVVMAPIEPIGTLGAAFGGGIVAAIEFCAGSSK